MPEVIWKQVYFDPECAAECGSGAGGPNQRLDDIERYELGVVALHGSDPRVFWKVRGSHFDNAEPTVSSIEECVSRTHEPDPLGCAIPWAICLAATLIVGLLLRWYSEMAVYEPYSEEDKR